MIKIQYTIMNAAIAARHIIDNKSYIKFKRTPQYFSLRLLTTEINCHAFHTLVSPNMRPRIVLGYFNFRYHIQTYNLLLITSTILLVSVKQSFQVKRSKNIYIFCYVRSAAQISH